MRLHKGAENPLTHRQVQELWPALECWNCHGKGGGVLWDQHCQQSICGACRAKRRKVLAALTVNQRIERSLGFSGAVVPGTHYPQGE